MDSVIEIQIVTPHLTLGQLLKLADVITNGGQAKSFLAEHEVKVNGENDNRRGRKLYPGDMVEVVGKRFRIVA